jgi:hypothetical protein
VLSAFEQLAVSALDGELLTADVTRTKTPIGSNMGNRGVMRDTEGNVIGVFESAQASKET